MCVCGDNAVNLMMRGLGETACTFLNPLTQLGGDVALFFFCFFCAESASQSRNHIVDASLLLSVRDQVSTLWLHLHWAFILHY